MAIPSNYPLWIYGDSVINAMTHGYRWILPNSRVVTWGMSNGFNGEYWNSPPAALTLFNSIFNNISQYANIKFQYAGHRIDPISSYFGGVDINFSLDASGLIFNNNNVWARAFFPSSFENQYSYFGAPGDVFLNLNSQANYLSSYDPGSAGYFVFLHEIGHAIGLKHPHDDGGTGHPTLANIGLANFDIDYMTIMSYADNADWNLTEWDPATPMVLDVLALQYLYGPNYRTNSGDNTYTLPLNNLYSTIWDGGGTDQVNVNLTTAGQGWVIYLPSFQLSKLVKTKVGYAVTISDEIAVENGLAPTNLYWLMGGIENIVGSIYDDYLYGNHLSNVISSGMGDDVLFGGTGKDKLLGSLGNDTYYVDNAGDKVYENPGEGSDWVNSSVSYTLPSYVENISLTGAKNLNAKGNDQNNYILGNSGKNILNGQDGIDTLTGGLGADRFVFSTLPTGSNYDLITDFQDGLDKIGLDDAVFKKLKGDKNLNDNIVYGNSALDSNDYLIYNSISGDLFYDADGNSANTAMLIATIGSNLFITAADFIVI